jgi:hypothetical protein
MRTVLDDMQRDPSSAHKHMQVTLSVYVCVCECLSVCVYLSGCFSFFKWQDARVKANIEALKT